MRLLIVGGTGNLSWRLSQAAIDAGWDVTILNRGGVDRVRRPTPSGCDMILGDVNDRNTIRQSLGSRTFDGVIDFLCYTADHAERAIDYFAGRVGHYILISSTAIYDRAAASVPLSETSPLINTGWDYALSKLAAERRLIEAHERDGFPATILRAGHTYDTIIPDAVGMGDWTNPWRLLNGRPIVIHGDGTTLWTLTHSSDFAAGIIELLKSNVAPGKVFQITSDEIYTWRKIMSVISSAIGVSRPTVCYRTAEEITSVSPRIGSGITGHKMWCDIYDNRRFKSVCPSWQARTSLEQGIWQAVRYYQRDSRLLVPNAQLNTVLDRLCEVRQASSLIAS